MNPAFRLEVCLSTAYITNTNLFQIKESYDRLTVPTVVHTFKTFFLPITKNLKL